MAAEIINLRVARKRKKRADKDMVADQNRIDHGRSKGERGSTDATNAKADRDLSGHQREPDEH